MKAVELAGQGVRAPQLFFELSLLDSLAIIVWYSIQEG